jgi:hypothetical protein
MQILPSCTAGPLPANVELSQKMISHWHGACCSPHPLQGVSRVLFPPPVFNKTVDAAAAAALANFPTPPGGAAPGVFLCDR